MPKSFTGVKIWMYEDAKVEYVQQFESFGSQFYVINIGDDTQLITSQVSKLEELKNQLEKIINEFKSKSKETNAVNA